MFLDSTNSDVVDDLRTRKEQVKKRERVRETSAIGCEGLKRQHKKVMPTNTEWEKHTHTHTHMQKVRQSLEFCRWGGMSVGPLQVSQSRWFQRTDWERSISNSHLNPTLRLLALASAFSFLLWWKKNDQPGAVPRGPPRLALQSLPLTDEDGNWLAVCVYN